MTTEAHTPEFWTDEEVKTIRSMAIYWREIRERDASSFSECAAHEVGQVRAMIGYPDGLLRMAEYCADPLRRAAPDLREACKALMRYDCSGTNEPDTADAQLLVDAIALARTAIASAKPE